MKIRSTHMTHISYNRPNNTYIQDNLCSVLLSISLGLNNTLYA